MLDHQPQRTIRFEALTDEQLREVFLAASQPPRVNGNNFFNSFWYKVELFNGNYSTALSQGISLLTKLRSLDEVAFNRIHKGTIYYWLGSAAYLARNPVLATLFMDAAVSEDLIGGADLVRNPTPAIRYILLEGEPPEQAARELVRDAQAKIQESVDFYNTRSGRLPSINSLTISRIRSQFLIPALSLGGEQWRSMATALINFRLEWDHNNELFDIRPGHGTSEPFFVHLFKGCVLFESLLKHNPAIPKANRKTKLNQLLPLFQSELGTPPQLNISGKNLPQILVELATPDNSIVRAIQITGWLRNVLGHNLGWAVQLKKSQYQQLSQMVMTACLHAIASLY